MVWSKVEPATGKRKYIKKFGNSALLTSDKRGAVDNIPYGWEVFIDNKGYLRMRSVR